MQKQWVTWFKLVNRSKGQTIDQLRKYLIAKGLSDGLQATEKAYELGFVRLREGRELWNLRRYIGMMQSDAKIEKLRAQNRPVHPAAIRRANPAGAPDSEIDSAFEHAIAK